MIQARKGDKVRVHYTGTLDDGTIFDSSEPMANTCNDQEHQCNDSGCGCGCAPPEPMEFTVGQGALIAKFEEAVVGLEPGQNMKVRIEADDAYGQRSQELVVVIRRSEIPAEINPQPGEHLEVVTEDGNSMPVLVREVSDTSITLDANHPLAGMALNFDIRLVEIVE